jgi:hypothetical protein
MLLTSIGRMFSPRRQEESHVNQQAPAFPERSSEMVATIDAQMWHAPSIIRVPLADTAQFIGSIIDGADGEIDQGGGQ